MITPRKLRITLATGLAALALVSLGASAAGAAEKVTAGRDDAAVAVSGQAQLPADTIVAFPCPPGTVPVEPPLNPALGPCRPNSFVARQPFVPIGCPPGWVPRPPELNPALGPCMAGTITSGLAPG